MNNEPSHSYIYFLTIYTRQKIQTKACMPSPGEDCTTRILSVPHCIVLALMEWALLKFQNGKCLLCRVGLALVRAGEKQKKSLVCEEQSSWMERNPWAQGALWIAHRSHQIARMNLSPLEPCWRNSGTRPLQVWLSGWQFQNVFQTYHHTNKQATMMEEHKMVSWFGGVEWSEWCIRFLDISVFNIGLRTLAKVSWRLCLSVPLGAWEVQGAVVSAPGSNSPLRTLIVLTTPFGASNS
jgi:hypothetical protein